MKSERPLPFYPLLLLFIALSGCQAMLSEQVRSTADEETLFEEIFENPDHHKGKIVILGGEVQQLRYNERKTEVEFSEIPLYKGGQPALGFDPGQRFFVIFPERLDPFLFKKGKVMTIAGRVIGARNVEGSDYPLFSYEEAYVWDKLREDRFPSFGAFIGQSSE
jgi:outer membrane lipoprotein